jgi:nucleoside 2-deoxyribosyltransferase
MASKGAELPRIYVASPLGFAASSDAYREVIRVALTEASLEVLDPWRDPQRRLARAFKAADAIEKTSERKQQYELIDEDAGARNHADLERAHAVLAILDGVDVDSGTAAEVGFAAASGIPVVGLRTDRRQTGENDGCAVNLQVEYFIKMHGGEVFETLGRAVTRLRKLAAKRQRELGRQK